jgi:hypothetical protein
LKIQTIGNFKGQPIKYLNVVGLTGDVKDALGDGKILPRKYDAEHKRLSVELNGNEREITLLR